MSSKGAGRLRLLQGERFGLKIGQSAGAPAVGLRLRPWKASAKPDSAPFRPNSATRLSSRPRDRGALLGCPRRWGGSANGRVAARPSLNVRSRPRALVVLTAYSQKSAHLLRVARRKSENVPFADGGRRRHSPLTPFRRLFPCSCGVLEPATHLQRRHQANILRAAPHDTTGLVEKRMGARVRHHQDHGRGLGDCDRVNPWLERTSCPDISECNIHPDYA